MSKVHIIAAGLEPHEARIVARLARLLAEGTGWSLSARVDTSATVNIYLPYLNKINARCETRQAAWFTHRDEGCAEKVKVWYHAARGMDLRATSARIYLADLSHYGPTKLITPPLDREKFALAPHKRENGAKPVVGTSGFVYPWGRKGEGLLAALSQKPSGLGCYWRASGHGWPVPTQMFHWHRVQEFYQALDCYVCTSTIEGIGYGPLEALATGVPVVVPWKVGIFDDLPEQPGVRHYYAGSLADLERAFLVCLEDRPDPEELRALTESYTVDAWVGGWRRAVDEGMGKTEEAPTVPLERPAVAPAVGAYSAPDPGALPSWRSRAGHSQVHIVLPDFEHASAILPRKARALAEATGWSLSPEPDQRAEVNYFFPYMAHASCSTLTAAYFTHREDQSGWPEKAARWDDVASQLELRLTSSRHNLPHLEPFGSTKIVRPPLDREKFCLPTSKESHARPVVGTSGFVSPWGRKGDTLLAALVETETGQRCDWRAAGKGWPVPTTDYPWAEMQTFYQGLDLYLSTSLIEGTGYGPLEALACGVPVVIPRGVGVWDDLPKMPGITRYTAGELAGLETALGVALKTRAEPEALRAATEPYSVEAWAEGHKMAMDELLSTASTGPLPDWRGNCGLYVVAFGDSARNVARRCIGSFKKHMPGIPVLLCSDRPLGPEDSLIVEKDADIGARSPKVRIYDLTPPEWKYVLYLDADVDVLQPLDSLFQWLQDGWELAICSNPGRFAVAQQMGRADNTGECQETFDLWGTDQMMQLGGGVFAFRRCPATVRLFHDWQREWDRYGKRDQGALLRAIWHQPVKTLLLLPKVWNCVCQADEKRPGLWKYPYDDPGQAAIMHYPMTARRWSGIVPQRSDTPEAWARVREWERAHGQAVRA